MENEKNGFQTVSGLCPDTLLQQLRRIFRRRADYRGISPNAVDLADVARMELAESGVINLANRG
jgi:hypothetical protein